MRTVASKVTALPSGFSAVTFTTAGLGSPAEKSMGVTVMVSEPSRPSVSAFCPSMNCSGRMPMPMRLERWMRSKLSAMATRTPSSIGPLAAQSRDEPLPYILPASTAAGVSEAA